MTAGFDTSGVVYARRSDGFRTGRWPWRWEELPAAVQAWVADLVSAGRIARYRDVGADDLTAKLAEAR